MRTMILAAALASGLGTSASAGQPIHESLMECSVLVDLLLGEQSFAPGQDEMINLYAAASRSMRAEALSRTSAAYVAETATAKTDLWHRRWDAGGWDDPANRGELVEWWTYCFKLAEHLELPLKR